MPARESLSIDQHLQKRNSERDGNGGIPKELSITNMSQASLNNQANYEVSNIYKQPGPTLEKFPHLKMN